MAATYFGLITNKPLQGCSNHHPTEDYCIIFYKGKAIPIQAWTGAEGSSRLRLPDLKKKSAHERGKVVSPTHRPPLPPRKYSWYSFPLEAS